MTPHERSSSIVAQAMYYSKSKAVPIAKFIVNTMIFEMRQAGEEMQARYWEDCKAQLDNRHGQK